MSGFTGLYIGNVVDNKDPLQLGRIKVRIPTIFGNIPIEDLPWCEPCFPYGYNDTGIFFIPEKDALVSIMFLNGSQYKPVWMGAIFRENHNIIPQIAKSNYPERKTIKTKVGYILFDDKTNFIEIKHKSGSSILFSGNGDIVIHAKKDAVIISDNNILENPVGKTNVIALPEYKSNDEISVMSEEEVKQYKNNISEFKNKTEGNCGSTKSDVGASQKNSDARIWGSQNRASITEDKKLEYLNSVRILNKSFNDLAYNSKVDLSFTNDLAIKLETSLQQMKNIEPALYKKFKITDGFRNDNNIYGATDSLHKYGGAFDWNYSEFADEEREKIYRIFGENGICCPLDSWQGQDEGMHMELAKSIYTPVLKIKEEIIEPPYQLIYESELNQDTFDITEIYKPDFGKVGVSRNGISQIVELDYIITEDKILNKYYIKFNTLLEENEIIRII